MRISTRSAAPAAIIASMLMGVAACGDDSAKQSSNDGGSGATTEAVAEAEADVDLLLSNPPLKVEPLSEAPATDLKVASVTCTLTACKPGEFLEASGHLGWDASEETYDLAKGPADFVAAVRRAVQSGPDALAILFVYPPDLIDAELQQAKDDGVVLVDIGSALETPPDGFISCVACAPGLYADGIAEANFVAVDAGDRTSVGIVGDKTIDANVSATKGFIKQFDLVSPESEVHEINLSYSQTPQANSQTVVSALQREPDIAYLVFQSPDLLSGVSQALNASRLNERVKVVGLDPSGEEQVELLGEGGVDAWVGADGPVIWWRAVDAIARQSVGDDVDPTPIPALRVITEDNLEPGMFAPRDFEDAFTRAWSPAS